MQKKHLFLGLLILGTGFWGVSFIFVKQGVGNSTPYVFLAYKFLIAAFILGSVFFKQLKLVTLKTVKISVLTGVPLLAGTLLQTTGLKYTTVSNSAFITGLDVLLIPVFKFLIYKKEITKKTWVACAIALTGLYIVAIKENFTINKGDLWTVACAFGFALYVLQVGKFSNEKSPLPSVILLMLFCGISCSVIALFDHTTVWLPQSRNFWPGVLFSAVLSTAYMYTIQNYAQRHIGEEKVALAYLFEPIFATVAGVVLLGEDFTTRTLTGGFLIVLAMVISEIRWSMPAIFRKQTA